MRLFWSVVNAIAKAIAWCLAILFGFLVAIIVMTVVSIAWAGSPLRGLLLLGFFLLLICVGFYRPSR